MVALFGKKILSLIKDPETLAKVQSEIAPPVPTITIKDLDDLEKNIKALPEPPNKRLQMHLDIFDMKGALVRDIKMCYDERLHIKVKQFADTMERWIKSDWYLESRYMIDFARYKRNLVKYRAYDVSKWNIKELMFKARPRLDEYIVYIDLNKGMWQSSQIVGALLEEYRCPIISKIVSNR